MCACAPQTLRSMPLIGIWYSVDDRTTVYAWDLTRFTLKFMPDGTWEETQHMVSGNRTGHLIMPRRELTGITAGAWGFDERGAVWRQLISACLRNGDPDTNSSPCTTVAAGGPRGKFPLVVRWNGENEFSFLQSDGTPGRRYLRRQ